MFFLVLNCISCSSSINEEFFYWLTWAEGSSELFWSKFVRRRRCCKLFTISSSSPEPLSQFQPNLSQSILRWRGFKFVQMKGLALFQRGDNYQIGKIHWRNKKKSSSPELNGPISTKLGTMHPWVTGIQVCSNEGPRPLPRGDNYEIAKIHWRNSKISSPEPVGQFKQNSRRHFW